MILSGFAVPLFQALITLPPVRVAVGTAKPDTHPETGHCSKPISVRKCLIFGNLRPDSAYFTIPDNITADSQRALCVGGGTPGEPAGETPTLLYWIDPRRAHLLPVGTIHRSVSNMTNQTAPEVSDTDLVARAKAGELDAFEALTNRYEQRVYSLALRMLHQEQDAEDVTQQTFLSALESLGGFRGDASFATWLLRIATHAALKVIRKRKGLDTVSLEAATEEADSYGTVPHPEYIADWRQSPEELVRKHETQRLLDDALAKLDEKHRLVFLLRDVEGLSVKETAEALGLSEANTKVRLLRARLQLREQLTLTLGDPDRRAVRTHPPTGQEH